jgi:hypothetical protein
LVNRNGVSIHHVANTARFCPTAFIFDERRARMVNRWCVAAGAPFTAISGVNSALNRICLKGDE